MLPQYKALCVSLFRPKKIVCPFVGLHCGCVPLPCENTCVRSLGYIVGASLPCENICVHLLSYIMGASPPLCVRSIGNTVGASPPRVCPFIGRQSSLDPCMLPTPLCGIFFYMGPHYVDFTFAFDTTLIRLEMQSLELGGGGGF